MFSCRILRAVAATTAVVVLAACSSASGRSKPAVTIDPSTNPVSSQGFIWASGSTVHLADGSTIDTGSTIDVYVVAGDGVFFIPSRKRTNTEADNRPAPKVRFADRAGKVTSTGLNIDPTTFAASPDGRYLGGVDFVTGRKDSYGTPQARSVVIDLSTGKQILDTPRGMGDPDSDIDLLDLYEEGTFTAPDITNASATFSAPKDSFVYTFANDTLRSVDGSALPQPPEGDELLTSPDKKWRIEKRGLKDQFVASDGHEVTPKPGTSGWGLNRWIDDRTVAGVALNGPVEGKKAGPRNSLDLMTCTVPTGECDVIKGTAGTRIVFPAGTLPYSEATLKDVETSDD